MRVGLLVFMLACRSATTAPPVDVPAPSARCSASEHAEFGWPLQCVGNECTPAKGFQFIKCGAGATANCTKPDNACDVPDPACAAQGNYRVEWQGGCHEGCVRAEDCAPS
jgi:hypothetical protein